MARAYAQAVRPKAFTEGQLELRTAEHVRRNLPRPSKFAPKWEGPYIIREAHDNGYYYLTKEDGTVLTEPINGKWLKQYLAYEEGGLSAPRSFSCPPSNLLSVFQRFTLFIMNYLIKVILFRNPW